MTRAKLLLSVVLGLYACADTSGLEDSAFVIHEGEDYDLGPMGCTGSTEGAAVTHAWCSGETCLATLTKAQHDSSTTFWHYDNGCPGCLPTISGSAGTISDTVFVSRDGGETFSELALHTDETFQRCVGFHEAGGEWFIFFRDVWTTAIGEGYTVRIRRLDLDSGVVSRPDNLPDTGGFLKAEGNYLWLYNMDPVNRVWAVYKFDLTSSSSLPIQEVSGAPVTAYDYVGTRSPLYSTSTTVDRFCVSTLSLQSSGPPSEQAKCVTRDQFPSFPGQPKLWETPSQTYVLFSRSDPTEAEPWRQQHFLMRTLDSPSFDGLMYIGHGFLYNNRDEIHPAYGGMLNLGGGRFVREGADTGLEEVRLPVSPLRPGTESGAVDIDWVHALGGNRYLVFYSYNAFVDTCRFQPMVVSRIVTAEVHPLQFLPMPDVGQNAPLMSYPEANQLTDKLTLKCMHAMSCLNTNPSTGLSPDSWASDLVRCRNTWSTMVSVEALNAFLSTPYGDCSGFRFSAPDAWLGTQEGCIDGCVGTVLSVCRTWGGDGGIHKVESYAGHTGLATRDCARFGGVCQGEGPGAWCGDGGSKPTTPGCAGNGWLWQTAGSQTPIGYNCASMGLDCIALPEGPVCALPPCPDGEVSRCEGNVAVSCNSFAYSYRTECGDLTCGPGSIANSVSCLPKEQGEQTTYLECSQVYDGICVGNFAVTCDMNRHMTFIDCGELGSQCALHGAYAVCL